MNDAFDRAVKCVGGVSALAEKIGARPSRVSNWRKRGVPPEVVIAIEKATERRVTRYELRPDIYPTE